VTIKNTQQKVSKTFGDNFEDIFGKFDKPKSGSFTQGADGKMVQRGAVERTGRGSADIMQPLKDFKSPIDGQIITSRQQLAEHNKRHGVTNSQDYNNGYIEKRADARNKAGEKYIKETRKQEVTTMVDKILYR
jgi:hypothetical protein